MPKVTYRENSGLVEEPGAGVEIEGKIKISRDDGSDEIENLDVTRTTTLRTSPTIGVNESSGSLLMLKGRAEGLFFHVGGNQYISSNAYFDANAGDYGSWKYQTSDSAAFRWGFRGGEGAFELEHAIRGTANQIITGSDWYETSGSWGVGLSLSASNGCIAIGKKVDRSTVRKWDGSGVATTIYNGANAAFDVTGSVKASPSARSLAVAVTGSAEFGCGAPDGYIMFPLHNNTSRDALTAIEGMVIYNTETHKLNFYNGTGWYAVNDTGL
tara:strand:- start:1347 stop:2156 length:810 start_codon:yes stop_codon:yes gene_type:complete